MTVLKCTFDFSWSTCTGQNSKVLIYLSTYLVPCLLSADHLAKLLTNKYVHSPTHSVATIIWGNRWSFKTYTQTSAIWWSFWQNTCVRVIDYHGNLLQEIVSKHSQIMEPFWIINFKVLRLKRFYYGSINTSVHYSFTQSTTR